MRALGRRAERSGRGLRGKSATEWEEEEERAVVTKKPPDSQPQVSQLLR